MMNRSSERPPIDPTMDAIRDDLPRDVLSYAEGIRREMYVIARRYGVEKPADIGPKIESGEVSMADMERMIDLKTALEKVVMTKKFPFRLEEFMESLREIGEADADITRTIARIDCLPVVPFDQLISRVTFMQEAADILASTQVTRGRERVGALVSRVVVRAMEGMPPELLERVRQEVRGDGMRWLGYRWSGGTLVVTGEAGEFLGAEMSGGTIIAASAMRAAGDSMTGGFLRIKGGAPIDFLGTAMKGGSIKAEIGGKSVGELMSGGSIWVEAAGECVGMNMRDGEIRVVHGARDGLGKAMTGGLITVHHVFAGTVGLEMEGGTIRIEAVASRVGTGMKGGTIEVFSADDAGTFMKDGRIEVYHAKWVGNSMDGGTIVVNERAEIVGEQMVGGEIVVRGTAGEIVPLGRRSKQGFTRHGGTIRYDGTWAWWKNLFV